MTIIDNFKRIRQRTELICQPLYNEDYSVQPADFVSPPKWHLAHSTWFFEAFVLQKYMNDYKVYNKHYSYLFNSYYNNIGTRVTRINRGFTTRPGVVEIYNYRNHVNEAMIKFLNNCYDNEILKVVEIGLHHEEQHQELLTYDIKYILGNQVMHPYFSDNFLILNENIKENYIKMDEGLYEIGSNGIGFSFDNEFGRHKVYLHDYEISNKLVTNGEFIDFINNNGYHNFNLWHDDGWYWKENEGVRAPLYWQKIDDEWHSYDLTGLTKINYEAPLQHISFYEAFAFAEFMGRRLPTEFEWEIASENFKWGNLWEHTQSAYLPYPNYQKASGALGEYNGKFMVNQMVLRGASVATPSNHSRKTYRNFFHPNMRWHFSGLRLVRKRENL